MPRFANLALEIKSCWQVLDLLTFCCHIVRVEGSGCSFEGLLRLVSVVLAISPTRLVVVPVRVRNQSKGQTRLPHQDRVRLPHDPPVVIGCYLHKRTYPLFPGLGGV
jgi:hypothetical protein